MEITKLRYNPDDEIYFDDVLMESVYYSHNYDILILTCSYYDYIYCLSIYCCLTNEWHGK